MSVAAQGRVEATPCGHVLRIRIPHLRHERTAWILKASIFRGFVIWRLFCTTHIYFKAKKMVHIMSDLQNGFKSASGSTNGFTQSEERAADKIHLNAIVG